MAIVRYVWRLHVCPLHGLEFFVDEDSFIPSEGVSDVDERKSILYALYVRAVYIYMCVYPAYFGYKYTAVLPRYILDALLSTGK